MADTGETAEWAADHDGYLSLSPPARHRRSVRLDRAARSITIVDQIDGGDYDVRIAFHLGPEVEAELDGSHAVLSWPTGATPGEARLELPPQLRWSLHRSETDPILGWYSPGLGQRVPAFTLLGCGRCTPSASFVTRIGFLGTGKTEKEIVKQSDVSRPGQISAVEDVPGIRAEAG